MPVALIRTEPSRAYAPLASLEVLLGSAPDCDVVDPAPGVAPRHARLRYVKGAWLLTPADDQRVLVNDEPVPLLQLQDGDVLRLSAQGRPWTFRDRLADTFIAPGMTVARTWCALPRFREPAHGPDRAAAPAHVVKRGLPLRRADDADRHLRVLARLGGSPHRALARLVDGGLHPHEGGVARWMATRYVEGTVAKEMMVEFGLPPERVLPALADLAAGLAHLHARGVIHRDVAPGNVVLAGDGGAVLIDFDRATLADEPLAVSAGVTGTAGYVAPEEVLEGAAAVTTAVDVYGLCAVAYALLVGEPPADGAHVLDALSRAARRPTPPSELGVAMPPGLESVLMAGLDPDPTARPDAATLRDKAEQLLRVGEQS